MARISFKGFKDPATRPRYIIWALVAVLVIAGVMIPVLGVTSTRWFCSEGCHKVQDDTITAYRALCARRDQLHGLPHAGGGQPGHLPHPQGRGAGRAGCRR